MSYIRLALALCALLSSGPAGAADYRDSDWSSTFYENCPPPRADSITWDGGQKDKKLRFQLRAGDQGGCRSDGKSRGGVRFWERAELRQRGNLAQGTAHDIRFSAQFLSGFNGQDETFFQIHGWSKTCNSAPLMMMRFTRGKMDIEVLQRKSDPFANNPSRGDKGALAKAIKDRKVLRALNLKSMGTGPHAFRIRLDLRSNRPRIAVWMNGQTIVKDMPMHIRSCSQPHVKFGLYRPGKRNKASSVLLIDDVTLRSGG